MSSKTFPRYHNITFYRKIEEGDVCSFPMLGFTVYESLTSDGQRFETSPFRNLHGSYFVIEKLHKAEGRAYGYFHNRRKSEPNFYMSIDELTSRDLSGYYFMKWFALPFYKLRDKLFGYKAERYFDPQESHRVEAIEAHKQWMIEYNKKMAELDESSIATEKRLNDLRRELGLNDFITDGKYE